MIVKPWRYAYFRRAYRSYRNIGCPRVEALRATLRLARHQHAHNSGNTTLGT